MSLVRLTKELLEDEEYILMSELIKISNKFYYSISENREEVVEIFNKDFSDNYYVSFEVLNSKRDSNGVLDINSISIRWNTISGYNYSDWIVGDLSSFLKTVIEFFTPISYETFLSKLKETFSKLYDKDVIELITFDGWKFLANYFNLKNYKDDSFEEDIKFYFSDKVYIADNFGSYKLSLIKDNNKLLVKFCILEYSTNLSEDYNVKEDSIKEKEISYFELKDLPSLDFFDKFIHFYYSRNR